MPRVTYKQYEHDPNISVPKTTKHNKRKRQIAEKEINEYDDHDSQVDDDQVKFYEVIVVIYS